ncbi:hypothetical protein LTR56_025580, partial [Elasticomyces elasticus]
CKARQAKGAKAAPRAQATKMPEPRKEDKVEVNRDAAMTNPEGLSGEGGSRQQETIEDFEDDVVDYSDEEAPAEVVKRPDQTRGGGSEFRRSSSPSTSSSNRPKSGKQP